MKELDSARLGLLKIIEQLKENPSEATELLKEFKVYWAGVTSSLTEEEKELGLVFASIIELTKTFHEINVKQNKDVEDLRTNLNNALGRISKLEEKRGFDKPEGMI